MTNNDIRTEFKRKNPPVKKGLLVITIYIFGAKLYPKAQSNSG